MKNFRAIESILAELVGEIRRTIQITEVVDNAGVSQTISACSILYAQRGFLVTINSLVYEILAVDFLSETMTLKPTFLGDPTIAVGTIFDLYPPYFFHGTPVTTQTELNKIKDASQKTPMIWLWQNQKAKIFSQMLIERTIPGELYALTQPPERILQMTNTDLYAECVEAMRRLWALFIERMEYRTDIFDTDDLEYSLEDFPRFGIIARNYGSNKSLFFDNLSGMGSALDMQLYFKDECDCPPPVPLPIPPAWILASGFWDDAGVWIDTSAWID